MKAADFRINFKEAVKKIHNDQSNKPKHLDLYKKVLLFTDGFPDEVLREDNMCWIGNPEFISKINLLLEHLSLYSHQFLIDIHISMFQMGMLSNF